jgi:hypothetical protein
MLSNAICIVLHYVSNASSWKKRPMPFRKLMRAFTVAIVVGASSSLAALQPALASAPVPKTFVGCVLNGAHTNENGYVIRIHQSGGALLILSQWEKKMLRITGNLLPGDNFYLTAAPVVVGPCR